MREKIEISFYHDKDNGKSLNNLNAFLDNIEQNRGKHLQVNGLFVIQENYPDTFEKLRKICSYSRKHNVEFTLFQ